MGHSPTDGHLGCFHLWTVVNNAAENIHVRVFVQTLVNVPSWEGRFRWGRRRCSGTSVDAMAVKHRGCTKRHSRVLQISCSASFISVQNRMPPVARLPHFGKPVLTGARRLPQCQALRACAQNTGQCRGCQSHAGLPAPIRGLFLQHHTALIVELPPLQSP